MEKTIQIVNKQGNEISTPETDNWMDRLARINRENRLTPSNPMGMPVPERAPDRLGIKKDADGLMVTVEKYQSEQDKMLGLKVCHILRTTYPNYKWSVQRKGRAKDPFCVQIKLIELFQWGGDKIGMFLNRSDWTNETEFRNKIQRIAGELLERSRLSREKKKDLDEVVEKRPDGFEELDPIKKTKIRLIESVDDLVSTIKDNEKVNKPTHETDNAIITDSDLKP